MHPSRTSGLDVGWQPDLFELLAQGLRRLPHQFEIISGWIQIEDHLIGIVESVNTAQPDVRRNASLVA